MILFTIEDSWNLNGGKQIIDRVRQLAVYPKVDLDLESIRTQQGWELSQVREHY
jgi:hypothetical protein